jgi:hypothetical protein
MGTCRSATALVRVKRGSTWMIVAPARFASITQRKPTGWHSAMFDPWMRMQSLFCEVLLERGGAAASERDPQTGDVELCHIRAWFSTWITPSAGESFLIR